MKHFELNYINLKYPLEKITDIKVEKGLRLSQLGAIHAISSHFAIKDETALITMPTGTGKTVVIMMAPYILRSKRVLVITRNKLVRTQITYEFNDLHKLKEINVIEDKKIKPKIFEINEKIDSKEKWQKLYKYDVVIAIPNSISPEYNDIPSPPLDLFDLILVDEAHHSPAKTWIKIMDSFPNAKKILFTATPFRRDRKEIKAIYIYTYPLSKAIEENVFGKVRYIPVIGKENENIDIIIAKKTEEVFSVDKKNKLQHSVLVRTDSKKRADELREIYKNHTKLKLELIHSGHTYTKILNSIKKLRDGSIDGIICVDMLGEGFDFPNLKIAAIHSPHKSLEVTLQFIGRFARVNAEFIGEAKFIAETQDIKNDVGKLYKESSEWSNLLVDLGENRILFEENLRKSLDSFITPSSDFFKTNELSLYSLNVYHHVKIYKVDSKVDLQKRITFDDSLKIIYKNYSSDLNTSIYVTREIITPKWIDNEKLNSSLYDLFVIFFDKVNKFLFINSTRRTDFVYESIIKQLNIDKFELLPVHIINRVLRDLENVNFFNIGLKNKMLTKNIETYRIMASKNAENAIDPTLAIQFDRGHLNCKGSENGSDTTIGYSIKSKVWSNQVSQIPHFIDWCKSLSCKLMDPKEINTQTKLDFISYPSKLKRIPEDIIAAVWDEIVFSDFIKFNYTNSESQRNTVFLLDVEIVICNSKNNEILFKLIYNNKEWNYKYRYEKYPNIVCIDKKEEIFVYLESDMIKVSDFLNSYPLSFYTSSFSRITGGNISVFTCSENINEKQIITHDWNKFKVDISSEFGKCKRGKISIHNYLINLLTNGDNDIVFYDHRTGEIADFITIKEKTDNINIQLYHCKASSGKNAGDRTKDVYEVTSQVVKSLRWLTPEDINKKIKHRFEIGSKFLIGDLKLCEKILSSIHKRITFNMIIVQPGISKSKVLNNRNTSYNLAAAYEYIKYNKCESLFIWSSS